MVFRRVFWDRGVLFGACHCLIRARWQRPGAGYLLAWQPALISSVPNPGDNCMQCAAERCARSG